MRHTKWKVRALVSLIGFGLFFGFLYPELIFLPNTYQVTDEAGKDITDRISSQEVLDYLLREKPLKVRYVGKGFGKNQRSIFTHRD